MSYYEEGSMKCTNKAKRLKAWTCEAYVKREKFVCTQSDYKYSRHDRTDYHQHTMERPRTFDPTEFKDAIRHLNGTDDPQLNAFDYSNSFTFFDDIQNQRRLETKQPPFRKTKLNTFHFGAFARITNSQIVLNATIKEKLFVGTAMSIYLKKIVGLELFEKMEYPMMTKIHYFIMDTLYFASMTMIFANLLF